MCEYPTNRLINGEQWTAGPYLRLSIFRFFNFLHSILRTTTILRFASFEVLNLLLAGILADQSSNSDSVYSDSDFIDRSSAPNANPTDGATTA